MKHIYELAPLTASNYHHEFFDSVSTVQANHLHSSEASPVLDILGINPYDMYLTFKPQVIFFSLLLMDKHKVSPFLQS